MKITNIKYSMRCSKDLMTGY